MLSLLIKMLPLVLMTLSGYVLNRLRVIDAAFNRQLSLVMLNLFYPCLIISSILRNFTWETLLQNWIMPLGAAIIMLTGWLLGALTLPLARGESEPTRRSYHFACMMNNYSFLPIIMASALWRDNEMAVALILFSGLGSELCVWTLGIKALTGQRLGWRLMRHLVSLPMGSLLSSMILLALGHYGARLGWLPSAGEYGELPRTLLESARLVGGATIPASAIICGSRIAMLQPERLWSRLMTTTTILRLVVVPAIALLLLRFAALEQQPSQILALISLMPAAMASVSMAEAYGGDPEFAAGAVFITHLACLATIPLWLWLIF